MRNLLCILVVMLLLQATMLPQTPASVPTPTDKTASAETAPPPVEGFVLRDGTPLRLRTARNLTSANAQTDEERRSVTSIYEGFLRVLRSPLPTIAAVNGPAVGAGMNLALACDVRLAAASARFDTRFLKIGLHPGGGHVWMLERAVGPQAAAAMVLFGVAVDGARAAEIGLAWSCHPDAELLDAARALAARATRAPIPLLNSAKATLREAAWQPDFETAIATEVERQAWSLGQGWFSAPQQK